MAKPLKLKYEKHSKKGIVALNYSDLVSKCKMKFGFQNVEEFKIYLDDDTEIDEEYFEFIEAGSQLIIKHENDTLVNSLVEQFREYLFSVDSSNVKLKKSVNDTLQDLPKLIDFLIDAKKEQTEVTFQQWIKGCNTKFKTKEDVMRNSAESRLRGYYDKVQKELREHINPIKTVPTLQYLKKNLIDNEYHRYYFDRKQVSRCLCDARGMFLCQGEYNKDVCLSMHSINPYLTREERIIFSTWNLDHVIEKSRCIIPALKEALSSGKGMTNINLEYFYNILFQIKCPEKLHDGNLKLVHIACHVKSVHNVTCSVDKIYNIDCIDGSIKTNQKNPRNKLAQKRNNRLKNAKQKAILKRKYFHSSNALNYPITRSYIKHMKKTSQLSFLSLTSV